ncbi:hypothetical protein QAA19_002415 [Salmonella enterica]|nr:hypothetical protein [Salmonella enterica subsp. enterica serovar Bareilly str. CFSAN000189]EHL2769456.1 hypothetical protein [Salmonella enterica subsp. enterica serovar Hvittingfoss]EHL2847754.1 hypothetical protein [Salmonella enterica subsp. enterica serovar Hvittingfoss]EKR9884625.1 hypothetical protein [Salmonella enterica]HCL5348375.1 hypothetical protein [Salmonella enterica]
MLQMKFKPRFIEAFRSGQKITSLRMMDFRCRCYDGHDYPPVYIHSDTLKYRTHVDTAEVFDLSLPAGLAVKYTSDLAGLLKRQPYQQGDDIELVAVYDSGEIAPFATATIGDISVIKGDRIEDIDAIHDGFNPDRDPLAELLAFMRNIYPTKDPLNEMYWLYTFTNIQMLPMQGGAA